MQNDLGQRWDFDLHRWYAFEMKLKPNETISVDDVRYVAK